MKRVCNTHPIEDTENLEIGKNNKYFTMIVFCNKDYSLENKFLYSFASRRSIENKSLNNY